VRAAEAVRTGAAYLERHGVDSPTVEAETLLMQVLGTTRAGLYVRREELELHSLRVFGRSLHRRRMGDPLQHVTGEHQFLDLTFAVAPGVFVPRPETEVVALVALETLEGRTKPLVIDVGTGTGIIAITIAHRRPDATVIGTDVSSEAVALARSNAERLGARIDVRLGDLLDPVPGGFRGSIDLIVSNPPYVTGDEYRSLPPDVRADPRGALVGGTDVHARLVETATEWLAPDGWLVVEIGATQGSEVRAMFERTLTDVEVLPDLAGRDRVVRGRRP
jgi:release factor glutamine methyltransferase